MKAEYKGIKADYEAVTRNPRDFDKETGNIYETVYILSRRADQIASEIKEEQSEKMRELASSSDNLEEIHENRDLIESAKYYEQIPKPTLLAIKEFEDKQVYYNEGIKEDWNS